MWSSFVDEMLKIASAVSASRDKFNKNLPKGSKVSLFPSMQKQTTQMNIQAHDAPRAGKHFDLRIQDPDKPIAHSWAIPRASLPAKVGDKRLAVRQPDHRSSYMGFSGILNQGYGKGKVDSQYHGPIEVVESTAGKVRFTHDKKEYMLHRTKSDKNWLLRRVK